jgi:hypothetical protein
MSPVAILLLTLAAVQDPAPAEPAISGQVACDAPAEVASGSSVRLQCTVSPELPAVALVLMQRPAGNEVFAPTPGLRLGKGRFMVSLCPDSLIPGAMHFYFEARDAEDRVLATSGNIEQPHVLTVRAPGDQNPLAAPLPARTAHIRDEDPLAAARQERQAEQRQATRSVQRQAGRFFVGFGAGVGYGYYPNSQLDFRSDLRIESNVGPAGLVLLTPEVGFQLTRAIALGLQLTWERLSGSGSGDSQSGSPATNSVIVLGRGSYHAGDGRLQLVASGFVGGGHGFRLVVPPLPMQGLLRNDSVRGGPMVIGPGLGVLYHLHPHAALIAESRLLAGMPSFATLIDLRVGAEFSF